AQFCGHCGRSPHQAIADSIQPAPQAQPRLGQARPARRKDKTRAHWVRLGIIGLALAMVLCVGGWLAFRFVIAPQMAPLFQRVIYLSGSASGRDEDGSNTTLKVINTNGDQDTVLLHHLAGIAVSTAGGRWRYLSSDGKWMAAYKRSGGEPWNHQAQLALISTATGEMIVTKPDAYAFSEDKYLGGFSPNGKYFAYTQVNNDTGQLSIHVVDMQGKTMLAKPGFFFVDFFPDNEQVLAAEYDHDQHMTVGLATVDIESGQDRNIYEIVADSASWIRYSSALSHDGKKVYLDYQEQLIAIDVDSGQAKEICPLVGYSDPRTFLTGWASDITIYDDQALVYATWGLTVLDLKTDAFTSIETHLTDSYSKTLGDGFPYQLISPDGTSVAYVSRGPDHELYVIDLETQTHHLVHASAYPLVYSFTPDSESIVYLELEWEQERGALYVTDLAGLNRRQLDRNVTSFRISPDGKKVIYSTVEGEESGNVKSSIYSLRLDGRDRKLVIEESGSFVQIVDVVQTNPGPFNLFR
ncbi:MAG: PD40 domain-containing protein, partial [Anaerolineae bacterium]|nr:PD40 domain-containing protein [Anaerolineae bacterium]